MNNDEIMVNEEVIEITDEIAAAGSGKGLKMAVGVGITVLGGYVAYKYLVKPLIAKIKTWKEQQMRYSEFDEFEDVDVVE